MLYFTGESDDFKYLKLHVDDLKYFSDLKALTQDLFQSINSGPQPILIDCAQLQEQSFKHIHRLYTLSEIPVFVLATREEIESLDKHCFQFIQGILHKPLHSAEIQILSFQIKRFDAMQRQSESHNRHIRQLLENNRDLTDRLNHNDSQNSIKTFLSYSQFVIELESEWKRAHRYTHAISLLGLEIRTQSSLDFSEKLQGRFQAMRSSDTAAKISEKSYILLLPVTPQEGIESVQQHYIDFLSEHFNQNEFSVVIHSTVPQQHNTAHDFLSEFETKMKAAAQNDA